MTCTKSMMTAVAIATLTSAAFAGISQAAEITTLKPLQGLSFKSGTTHGVNYFQSEHGACKLVLTFANDDDGSAGNGFTVTRHEASVTAGQNTRYAIGNQPFEFACQADAQAMTMKPLSRLASAETE